MATTSLNEMSAGKKPQNAVVVFSNFMEKFKGQIGLAIPKHLNTDRFTRLVLTAFSSNQDLQACRPESILASVMVAAQLGLELGVNGQGYLIPYKGTCTFVPGWRGIVDIVSRSGRASVWTGAVFDGDRFDFAIGDSPYVKHVPMGEDDPNKITHVYAVGRVNGAQYPVIEVWPIERVRRHFVKFNKVGDRHYAHKNWEMYARKVPLLQVCKYMPQSIELQGAMQAAYAEDEGRPITLDGDFVTNAAVPARPDVDPETGETSAPPSPPSQPTKEPAGESYAVLIDALKLCKNVDSANLVLDRGRHLPQDQYDDLVKFYKGQFAS